MKRYDYKCNECGKVWEYIQDDWQKEYNCKECPACKSTNIRRCISVPTPSIHYSPMHPRYRRGMGIEKKVKKKNQ